MTNLTPVRVWGGILLGAVVTEMIRNHGFCKLILLLSVILYVLGSVVTNDWDPREW